VTVTIRLLVPADWPRVRDIYAVGIATGDATFELEPPTWERFVDTHASELSLVAADPAATVVAVGRRSACESSMRRRGSRRAQHRRRPRSTPAGSWSHDSRRAQWPVARRRARSRAVSRMGLVERGRIHDVTFLAA